ncbi:GNAT family N-acetyltransferase [Leisingera thetidis]|uniref:GNAT family N-acetyltransferase n=1 Tax=Leisingera thetidis TaxID=2930199 RepID=UPI0021F7D091|nr:GNAT family N-acetyltransferase [Leisingera thetidis]
MFRIRKIADAHASASQTAIGKALAILRAQFPGKRSADIDALPEHLNNPFAKRFIPSLFVAENGRGDVRGTALLLFDPELDFAFLDILAATPVETAGSGTGGALYQRIRQEAAALGAAGLYFECLPDDPENVQDRYALAQNAARLKFYERYGARPITGTGYELPLSPEDTDMPHLVFDGLGQFDLPQAERLKEIFRAILERKYADLCPPEYVRKVVASVTSGGYGLRPPRYAVRAVSMPPPSGLQIPMIINDRHDIHHVHTRGYVESPVRVATIANALDATGLFARQPPRHFPDRWIKAVHDPKLVDFLRSACAEAPEKGAVYPYVFPVRNTARRPRERTVLAGYWCIDTFTPINRNAWPAARRAVDCTLTAAEEELNGAPAAYALIRPPGHHAEFKTFGGFCYLSNAAIAANFLSQHGRVAMLDIDYHHGNGQQDIFYSRADVLTVSVHGDPSFAYPYFTGFRDETGQGSGAGYNLNLPLAEQATPEDFHTAMEKALARIAGHDPGYLVLCLGFDTGRGDPTGTWKLRPKDFHFAGASIGRHPFPILVVQEGGYLVRTLGDNAAAFFTGLAEGIVQRQKPQVLPLPAPSPKRRWRKTLRAGDAARITRLVAETGKFSKEEIEIAGELAEERLSAGAASGYHFLLTECGTELQGYACFGPVPGSDHSWDLYWIAVAPSLQGSGLGRLLMERVEAAIRQVQGRKVYIDTSSSPPYSATRQFYERMGYALRAEFPDFYRDGDGKAVYEKTLDR